MRPLDKVLTSKWTKVAVFLLCLAPLGVLVWKGFHNDLTANPIEKITHETGDWTIYLLLITLSITPLRKLLRQPNLIRFRRMLGLFAFFYACLHLLIYVCLDQMILSIEDGSLHFDYSNIWQDIVQRPFITAGFTAFMLMLPLALTSTRGWIRRLGGKRWQLLHRLIYLSAAAGVIHYLWLVKSDKTKPLRDAYVLALLLLIRVVFWWRARAVRQPSSAYQDEAAPVR